MSLTQRSLESWVSQAQSHEAKINEYTTLLANRTKVEEGFTQLITTRSLNEELNGKLSALLKMNEKKSRLEKARERNKNDLLQEQAITRHKTPSLI